MFHSGVFVWSLIATFFIAFAALRFRAALSARNKCELLLPPGNQLSWRLPQEKNRTLSGTVDIAFRDESASRTREVNDFNIDSKNFKLWTPLTGAALADGVLAGLPVVQAVSHIDPFVLKAIEASTADHIHSFPSIHSYVEQHFFAVPALTADGWFERLTGYVAEQKAASALEAAGHHVTFAATANQPIWDLMVDGHPVQVKEGLSGVKAFLIEHHGIPVYTGTEAAAAVKDPMVHGLVGLNSVDIHESTHASIEGVSDTFDPGFHFPIITLGVACFREAKLLIRERTTWGKAVKHVGLDVAGVGTGAFAGAKAGAIAGSLLGPFGAAVAALIGAISGGIGGKLVSTHIRHAPFQQAKTAYEQVVDSAQLEIDTAVNDSRNQIRLLQGEYDTEFMNRREIILHKASSAVRSCAESYEADFKSFVENFEDHLDHLQQNLDEQRLLLLSSVPGSGIRQILYSTSNDHLRSAIRHWFRKAKRTILEEKRLFKNLEPRTVESLRSEIERFLTSYVFELDSLDYEISHLVTSFSIAQSNAQLVANEAAEELQRNRDELIHKFAGQTEKLHFAIVELIRTCNEKISLHKERFVIEARAVGLDL